MRVAGDADGVHVAPADVSLLGDHELRSRLVELGRAKSRLTAMEADALREIARRSGTAQAEHAAVNDLSVPGRAARSNVKAAVALGGLDETRRALASGSLPAGHAELIARAASEAAVDDEFLAERAQREGYDEFRRTLASHVADRSGDDGASLLERQRRQRCARVFTSRVNGMTVVNGQFDPITGARIRAAVDAAQRQIFREENPGSRSSTTQRTADAIAKLLTEPDAQRTVGTSLVLVADFDAVNQRLANSRLADGTPVPIGEIAKVAVDAGVLPAVFDSATGDLRMGRRQRAATALQRWALAVRDRGCIGCGAPPERCRAHHIVEWQHGGATDLDNLVSVCHHCHHHKIHRDGFTVERDLATGRYKLQPPASKTSSAPPADSRHYQPQQTGSAGTAPARHTAPAGRADAPAGDAGVGRNTAERAPPQ
ncbi:HNH endonuclease signature motif containing protein [Candidatus Poriferisodalis sp.]|uniref:HNH endonuclease signature motif containing protein n=1 Tax=Candidatus Poriferisodalis sp. TaxID=3101277 RepID=UPI003B022509